MEMNNRLLVFFKQKVTAIQVASILEKIYPHERNMQIDMVYRLKEAMGRVNKGEKSNGLIDIVILDINIPLSTRRRFVRFIRDEQIGCEFILVGNIIGPIKEEKEFIKTYRILYIPEPDELSLFSIMGNMSHVDKKLKTQPLIKKLIEETSKSEAIEEGEVKWEVDRTQLDAVIKYAIEETGKIFEATSGFVALTTLQSKFAKREPEKWQFGLEPDEAPALEIGVKNGDKVIFDTRPCIVGKVLVEGKFYNCPDTRTDEYYLHYGRNDTTISQIVIPLKFHDHTFGAFALNSPRKSVFSHEDVEILSSIATQMSLLIKRSQYLDKLVELNKPFKKIGNLEELYEEIVDKTSKILETKKETTYLRVLEKGFLVLKGNKGIRGIGMKDKKEIGKGITGRVAQTHEPEFIQNIQSSDSPYSFKDFAKKQELFGMMAVPIIVPTAKSDPDLIGVLDTYTNRIYDFTPLEVKLMLIIAEKAGEAIKKAKLIKQLDEISKIDKRFTTEKEQTVLKNIADTANELLDADLVVLYRYDSVSSENYGFSDELTISGDSKSPWNPYFEKDSFVVQFLDESIEEPTYIELFKDDPLISRLYKKRDKTNKFYEREKLKSAIILKLIYIEKMVGILFINYRYKRSFPPEDRRIAEIFANKAAVTVSKIRKIEELKRTTDQVGKGIEAIKVSGDDIVMQLNIYKESENQQVSEDQILMPIMIQVLRLINVDMGYIIIPDKMSGYARVAACSHRYNILHKQLLRLDFREIEWIKDNEKRYIIIKNVDEDDSCKRISDNPDILLKGKELNFKEDKHVKSALGVSIQTGSDVLGLITLESETVDAFSKLDAIIVMALANQASMALRNYQMIRQLRELRRIGIEILRKGQNIYEIIGITLKAVFELINKKDASIAILINSTTMQMMQLIPNCMEGIRINVNHPIRGIDVLEWSTYINCEQDTSLNETESAVTAGINARSDHTEPLLFSDELVGVLYVVSEVNDVFTDGDKEILRMLADLASIAIHLTKQRERLIEKDKEASLGSVVRETVHWVGNNITPIKIRADMIKRDLKKNMFKNDSFFKSLKDDVETIYKNAETALAVKSDLIDQGKNMEKLELIHLLKECCVNAEKENDVKVYINSEVETFYFYWDLSLTKKIFHYILKNAAHAIEEKIRDFTNEEHKKFLGEINVRVFDGGGYIHIEFMDNGKGILKKDLDRLYLPFFTTKGANKGSGVGLYYCKRTVVEMGGDIYVNETKPGVGTTFCLKLPFQNNLNEV